MVSAPRPTASVLLAIRLLPHSSFTTYRMSTSHRHGMGSLGVRV